MKKILLVPLVLVLFSCNPTKKAIADESKTTEKKETPSKPLYQVLNESAYQGKEEKSYEVIKDQAGLIRLYETINDSEVPKVDFSKERIVALFLGQKNSGGYAIRAKQVIEKDNKIHVTVEETAPKPGENATMALTNPFTIVKINSTKEIVFQ